MSCVVCGVVVVPLPWLPGQVMVQGLSSQGSVGRCVERIRVIGHVVLLGWVPCVPWCGRLIRTWACYSEPGQYRPRTEQAVHVWDSRLMCGTGRPRAGWPVDVRNRRTACRRRWPYTRLAASRANPLCGAWAFSSARGPAIPSLGNPAHMRNGRPTCGTGGPRAGCEGARVVVACGQSVTDRGAAAHARDAVCA